MHHNTIEENTGGITSVMRNMHPYFAKEFDVTYMTLPKSWQHGSTRANYFIYCWLHKNEFKKYDFVISHIPESSYFMVKSGVPCIHICHSAANPMRSGSWIKRPFIWFFDYLQNTIVAKCPLIYYVGKKLRANDKKLYNPLRQNVTPLPLEQRKGFVFPGRLISLKRVNRLIDIYSKLPENIRESNPFYIIGDGDCRESLENQVKSLGLEKQVIFKGSMPNDKIMEEVSSKKMVLMASTTEGFPTSIAEGFSVGLPAISTNVGSIPDVVKNDVNGFYLPKDFDDREYVKLIEKVFNDYPRFSEAALENSKVFNAERVTQGIIDDIHRMID